MLFQACPSTLQVSAKRHSPAVEQYPLAVSAETAAKVNYEIELFGSLNIMVYF